VSPTHGSRAAAHCAAPAEMGVGSGKKRRLNRQKAAAKREEIAAQQAAKAATAPGAVAPADTGSSEGFVRVRCLPGLPPLCDLRLTYHALATRQVKRQRKGEAAADTAGAAEEAEEPTDVTDATEDWITGGEAKQRQREQRAERKRKGRAAEGGAGAAAEKTSLDRSSVYVGGIPFSATEDEIRNFFSSHGCSGITSIRIPMKNKDDLAQVRTVVCPPMP
jgi:hypothetical protein